MVIPWVGFPLGDLLQRLEPTSRAKYVAFTTLLDPEQLPGQRRAVLDWPYVEGLRIDEATHPLTLLAVGLYGRVAARPERRAAPAGRAVEVRLQGGQVDRADPLHRDAAAHHLEPAGAAASTASTRNVNPEVDHPRWSQARGAAHRRVPARKTLPFNGYAEQVAPLYAGLDLRRNF